MVATLPLVQAFPADCSALGDIRRFIHARAREASLPAEESDDLELAVTEACRDMLAHERSSFMFVS